MQETDELRRMELETKKEMYLKKKEQEEAAKQAQADAKAQADGAADEWDGQNGRELEFEVRVTARDLWRFSMHHAAGGMKGIFNVLFTVMALFLLVTRWSTLTAGYRGLLVICVLIFTVWQPVLLYSKAKRQAKHPAMQQPMKLNFGTLGLRVRQNEQQVKFTWEQMARMDRIPGMIVLYMDRMHAYLIPDEVLGGRKEQFLELARTHLKPEQRRKI